MNFSQDSFGKMIKTTKCYKCHNHECFYRMHLWLFKIQGKFFWINIKTLHNMCISYCLDISWYILLALSKPIEIHFVLLLLLLLRNELAKPWISTYKIWTNGLILTFKVSKWPYWSSWHDKITCKGRQCLLGGQNWNKKNYPTIVDKIITRG